MIGWMSNETNHIIDDNYLNEMTIYCLGDIIPLNENKQQQFNFINNN